MQRERQKEGGGEMEQTIKRSEGWSAGARIPVETSSVESCNKSNVKPSRTHLGRRTGAKVKARKSRDKKGHALL